MSVLSVADRFPYTSWQVAGTAAGALALYQLVKLVRLLMRSYLSPLHNVPEPEGNSSLFFGHLLTMMNVEGYITYEDWFAKYGSTVQYRGLVLSRGLCTKDPRAISHVLTRSYDFPKPEMMRKAISKIFGEGVLAAEGEDHRRQRRLMNPCFGPAQIRGVMPIFYDKSCQLRDILLRGVGEGSTETSIDVFIWLTRATLDIIGLAGFGYEFNALNEGEKNELIQAFMGVLEPEKKPPLWALLAVFIPPLRVIPTERGRAVDRCTAIMNEVGAKLLNDRKEAVLAEQCDVNKKSFAGRDLLSVLIKANMATDTKGSERLTDREVIGQISTMLLAGHETSSTSISWLLYDLAKPENGHIQAKLRKELLSVKSNEPTMEELNALPYLDAVTRENLRINAVVDSTIRSAGQDDTIPLSEPFIDRYGVEQHEIHIGKGEEIIIPILVMNRDKSIWGEDAQEFKPERWLDPNGHPRSAEIPGVFSGLMTFIGGPHACIGYRFALIEMKVLVFVLLRHLRFELPVSPPKIERKTTIVSRPSVKQEDGEMKNSMPLRVMALRGA